MIMMRAQEGETILAFKYLIINMETYKWVKKCLIFKAEILFNFIKDCRNCIQVRYYFGDIIRLNNALLD